MIPPDAFQNFGLSLKLPSGKPGQKLQFKALQTYQGGEVVRWIGPESSDEPAPTVTLTAPVSGGGHGGRPPRHRPPARAPAATSAAGTAQSSGDGGGSDGLAIAALVVGALGLVAGIAGLLTARRARGAAAARDSEGVAA